MENPEVIKWMIGVVVVPLVTGLFALVQSTRWKLAEHMTFVENRFAKAREERITQVADVKAEAKAFTNENRRASDMQQISLRDEFKTFQLKVLEEFVPYRAMKEFEVRIMALLEKMDAKLERMSDRGAAP